MVGSVVKRNWELDELIEHFTLMPQEMRLIVLYKSIMETLGEAVSLGGLVYEKDLYNQPGGFKDFLVGYREGQPCPEYGATIQKIKTGSTASYICPNCQGEEDGVNG